MHLQPMWCGQASKQAGSKANRKGFRKASGITEQGREASEQASRQAAKPTERGLGMPQALARKGASKQNNRQEQGRGQAGRTTLAVDAFSFWRIEPFLKCTGVDFGSL